MNSRQRRKYIREVKEHVSRIQAMQSLCGIGPEPTLRLARLTHRCKVSDVDAYIGALSKNLVLGYISADLRAYLRRTVWFDQLRSGLLRIQDYSAMSFDEAASIKEQFYKSYPALVQFRNSLKGETP